MSGEPVIRPCRVADLAAVRAIYAVEVEDGTASFELVAPDLAEMTRRFEAVRAAGLPWLVAEAGGRVAGYGYAVPYRPRPAYRFTVEDSVYVAGWARGRGIGHLLLQSLIGEAAAAGRRQMVAIVGDSANRASIALHQRSGFRLVGTLQSAGFKFGRWLDTVILQRPLGDGAATTPEATPGGRES